MTEACDQIATFTPSQTYLAVVPLDGPLIEARQATVAAQLSEQTAAMIRRPILHTLLLIRTNATFQADDERDV